MQRRASGLWVKQTIQEGNVILCELPTGEWILGDDRNAQPIRSVDEVREFISPGAAKQIEESLKRLAEGKAKAAQAAGPAFLADKLDGMSFELRKEVEELVEHYLAIAPALRLQIKGMLQAFVGSLAGKEIPMTASTQNVLVANGAIPPHPPKTGPFKSASEEMFPGDVVVKEEPMSGGILRYFESGRKEFVPDAKAQELQMRAEAAAPETDAAPAYPCAFCQKEYPGEKSRDLHQERCGARPGAEVGAAQRTS